MQQFMIIALAHFLALLSPGPDFFLVARNAINSGWRIASGACLGIALANGAFIVTAFTGLSVLQQGGPLFTTLQLAGASYLLYIGVLFLRHAGQTSLGAVAGSAGPGATLGFAAGGTTSFITAGEVAAQMADGKAISRIKVSAL